MRQSIKLGGLILGTALMSGVASANAINPDHSVGYSTTSCSAPVVRHYVVYHHYYRVHPVSYRYYTPVTYRYYRTCDSCGYHRSHFLFW